MAPQGTSSVQCSLLPLPSSNPVAAMSLLSSQGYIQPVHAWASPPLLYIQPAKEDLHSSVLLLLLTIFPVRHALKELHKLHQLPLVDKRGLSGKKMSPFWKLIRYSRGQQKSWLAGWFPLTQKSLLSVRLKGCLYSNGLNWISHNVPD